MNKIISKRVIEIADYIIKTKKTIREVAEVFKISKSTVHKDIQERLKKLDKERYNQIIKIFQEHIETRHLLGGESTKLKYQMLKNSGG